MKGITFIRKNQTRQGGVLYAVFSHGRFRGHVEKRGPREWHAWPRGQRKGPAYNTRGEAAADVVQAAKARL